MRRSSSFALALVLVVAPAVRAQRFVDVTIKANDYAYVTPPASLSAGLTAFSFENGGTVLHELILVRARQGISPDSAARLWSSAAPAQIQAATEPPNGILIAQPGSKTPGRLLVDLQPGTYMLLCNFRDAPEKARHTALGMYTSFVVK